jgi:putative transport protein
MIALLLHSPLLLLFVVAALGELLGRVRVAGFSFGIAAVLFVGLGFGALHPQLKLPEIVYQLGLVLFVYTVGIASGPSFVAAFRARGVRDNLFVLGLLGLGGGLVALAAKLLHWSSALGAGVFTGAFTNTPALAGVIEALKSRGVSEATLTSPVVGYSVTYPVGVIGMLLAVYLARRLWHVAPESPPDPLIHRSALVEHPEAVIPPQVRLGRVWHGGQLSLAAPGVQLSPGDLVSVIGSREAVDIAVAQLGHEAPTPLEHSRAVLDMRRMVVSRSAVAGRKVAELHLLERFGAAITRLRRGDVDLLAGDEMVLELGDRVRVVAPAGHLDAVARLLGDSVRKVSEVNLLTFGLGAGLGLLLGLLPIPLPGGGTFRLGLAGGPLLVGLLLGALGRTGPFVWPLPYSANLTLRQLGLILFLAGVGTRSGWAFATTFGGALGAQLFVAGALITCTVALCAMWAGHRLLGIPFAHLTGLLAGMQTQPAVLAFAVKQTRSEEPNLAYAAVYPLATVSKIVIAQVLLSL